MDKKNISPNPQQPVDRVPTGQLPSALAELSEEVIGSLSVEAAYYLPDTCSYVETAVFYSADRCACSYDDGNE